jgi:hypothetical protein
MKQAMQDRARLPMTVAESTPHSQERDARPEPCEKRGAELAELLREALRNLAESATKKNREPEATCALQ